MILCCLFVQPQFNHSLNSSVLKLPDSCCHCNPSCRDNNTHLSTLCHTLRHLIGWEVVKHYPHYSIDATQKPSEGPSPRRRRRLALQVFHPAGGRTDPETFTELWKYVFVVEILFSRNVQTQFFKSSVPRDMVDFKTFIRCIIMYI